MPAAARYFVLGDVLRSAQNITKNKKNLLELAKVLLFSGYLCERPPVFSQAGAFSVSSTHQAGHRAPTQQYRAG